jgi:hypothetical protein
MNGDYPSTDFDIFDEGSVRRVQHLPTGMLVETSRSRADPIAVSSVYTLQCDDAVPRPYEIVQAALRHLRVWLIRRYGNGPGVPVTR